MPRPSPTVRRRRLGAELRRLRDSAGLTIEQVADALECSHSKISRIETAQVSPTPRDVRDMLQIYGVVGDQSEELVTLARQARQKDWWHAYGGDLPVHMAGLEAEAHSIYMYSALLIPGLLQTGDYARAVMRAIRMDLRPDEIDRRVEFRLMRQPLLDRDDPPSLWAVLDEAALRRLIGGSEIMQAQLQRLCEVAEAPHVNLQVIPFGAGAHAGLDGSFNIIGFPNQADPEVIFIETATSDLYLEDAAAIRRYHQLFDHVRAQALDPTKSAELLAKVAEEV
jgi:transcriptional regulator with XRE-family HTH domain